MIETEFEVEYIEGALRDLADHVTSAIVAGRLIVAASILKSQRDRITELEKQLAEKSEKER